MFEFKYCVNEENLINANNFKYYVKNFFDKAVNKKSNFLNSPEAVSVYRVCSFYRQFLFLINEPKIEILSGTLIFLNITSKFFSTALSIEEEFLLGLWAFVTNIGPMCGLKDLVKILENGRSFSAHLIFDVFYLLCNLVLYSVT